MIIVGEKINTSLKGVTEFVRERNAEAIQELAVSQAELGADYIDVNCGTLVDEEVAALPSAQPGPGCQYSRACRRPAEPFRPARMMSMITAGEALLNRDKGCRKYLKAHRKGLLV